MKILFVYSLDHVISLEKPLFRLDQIQFGISYISSLLKKNNHETELVILSPFLEKESYTLIEDKIGEFSPGLICYTSVSSQYEFIKNIATQIKTEFPDMFQLIGGPHTSLNPDSVINDIFDAICIGEGEFPTLELVSALDKGSKPSGIENLWIKDGDSIEKNSTRSFIEELDDLPFPDRNIWLKWIEYSKELGSKKDFISILLGRGCPFKCSFCSNHALKKVSKGKYVRYRSPENIIEEIISADKEFNDLETIYLEVETICLQNEWIYNLCKMLQNFNKNRENPVEFGTNLRITPNCDFDNIFNYMQKANFTFINIGLESGSEKIRKNILNRNYSNEDVIRTVKQAKNHGIKVNINNLIGIPGETPEDFKMTIDVNKECLPNEARLEVYHPYPGTDLYSYCIEHDLINKKINKKIVERRNSVLNLPGFPNRQIVKYYIYFQYMVYKGTKPTSSLILNIIDLKLNTMPYFKNFLLRVYRNRYFLPIRKIIKGTANSLKRNK